jgi:hypothetical protein
MVIFHQEKLRMISPAILVVVNGDLTNSKCRFPNKTSVNQQKLVGLTIKLVGFEEMECLNFQSGIAA